MFKHALLLLSLLLVTVASAQIVIFEYWAWPNNQGYKWTISTQGYHHFGRYLRPISYKWITTSNNCAVLFCKGSEFIKAHAGSTMVREDRNVDAEEAFDNIVISCGKMWFCPE